MNEIYQIYGDHLYKKGDFDGAITQYIETISHVEPSYVIRHFLDAQRIHNLTRYLQALHAKGSATPDHTTLLLNCYTKLKDVAKLNEFIKTENGLQFDVVTAITVCRQAGYWEHAVYLAHRHKEHHHYLKILLDDLQSYSQALAYIAALDFESAERYLKDYGLRLMAACPDACTTLLQRLCTDYRPVAAPVPVFAFLTAAATAGAAAGDANATSSTPAPAPVPDVPPPASVVATATGRSSAPDKASAEEFIHLFVSRPTLLISFLEHVVRADAAQPAVVYNTLLELYLRDTVPTDDLPATKAAMTARQATIFTLLRQQPPRYDQDHALVLCRAFGWQAGVLFLYEQLKLYNEILQHHMDRGDHAKVIEACLTYSPNVPTLWLQALTYFASQGAERELQLVLEKIDVPSATNPTPLLPPLMVMQILAHNPKTTLAAAKDYIIRNIEQQQADIYNDRTLIRGLQEETSKMRDEAEELRTSAKTFNAPKCHLCTSAIELPATHFLCGHSFHARCLSDQEPHCPKCFPDFRRVLEMKESMRQSMHQHEKFFKQLESSTDGFSTVAEYFGRGMFNAPPKGAGPPAKLPSKR